MAKREQMEEACRRGMGEDMKSLAYRMNMWESGQWFSLTAEQKELFDQARNILILLGDRLKG